MATYEEIYGKRVKEFDSDPTLDSSYEGQVWYNSTTGTLKSVVALEATSSQSALSTARGAGSAAGTTTAAIVAFGKTNPVPGSNISPTETWNGSGFSSSPNVNTGRQHTAAFGTSTSALFVGGSTPPGSALVESYDGSSFSETTDLNTARANLGASSNSPQTAGLVFGGEGPPATGATELWNGSSWSEQPDLNTARTDGAGAGISTSALFFGGEPTPANGNKSEEYNGTAWSNTPNLNTNQQGNAGAGANADSAISFGGPPPAPGTQIETFDGTSWTTSPATLATARYNIASGGSTSSTLAAGGFIPSPAAFSTLTEQYDKSINTITAAAWASGTALPASKFNMASEGTATAGIISGGELGPGTRTGETLYYDGTSWSDQSSAVSPAPDADNVQMEGTQTAAVLTSFRGGGSGPSDPAYFDAREWDGSTWTSIPSLSTQHTSAGMFRGDSAPTAATVFGGNNELPASRPTATEEYDGSSWTAGGAMPTGVGSVRGFGTPTTGVATGGTTAPGGTNRTANAIEYDGSTWTSANSMLKGLSNHGAVGTNSSGFVYAGYNTTPAGDTSSQAWDGTSFSTQPNLSTGRGGIGSGGTGSGAAAWAAGGNPPVVTTVEEFTPETTAVTAQTLTTS